MSSPDQKPDAVKELVGMTANLAAINSLIEIVETAEIPGRKIEAAAQGMFFLKGMKTGTEERIKELEAQISPADKSQAQTVGAAN